MFVLLFTSLREGYEDYKRYKKDKKSNNKMFTVHNKETSEIEERFKNKKSKKIHVGDIIKIYKNEEFPSDIYLLKSSNKNGICFIDTVNLDGENNLKDKKCNFHTQGMNDLQLCNLKGIVKCDHPNDQIDYWEGVITLLDENKRETTFSVE